MGHQDTPVVNYSRLPNGTDRKGSEHAKASDRNGTASSELDRVFSTSNLPPLAPVQRSAIKGVMRWRSLFDPALISQRETVKTFLGTLGYLPADRRILTNAERVTSSLDGTPESIAQDLIKEPDAVRRLVNDDAENLAQRYPGLTTSRAKVLQSIVNHELKLDQTDLSTLVSRFPFPLSAYSYFGRFLAGGCPEPDQAVRHLQFSTPFFIRMRSLLEGLNHSKNRFLVLVMPSDRVSEETNNDPDEDEDDDDDDDRASRKPSGKGLPDETRSIIHACIDHAHDFWPRSDSPTTQRMRVIEVPQVPKINERIYVDSSETTQFAAEYLDWLMFGKKDGRLLNRQELPPSFERQLKRQTTELATKRGQLQKAKRKAPKLPKNGQETTTFRRREKAWQRRVDTLESAVKTIGEEIQRLKDMRKGAKPALRELEGNRHFASGLQNFREKIRQAQARGERIVLSVLKNGSNQAPLFHYMDRVWSVTNLRKHPSIKCLRNCSFVMSAPASTQVQTSTGTRGLRFEQLRNFQINPAEINRSVDYVCAGILPDKTPANIALLQNTLNQVFEIPGVNSRFELTSVVREYTGKRNPSIDQYLEYVLDRTPAVSEYQFFVLADTLLELRHTKLPERCKEILVGRHHVPVRALVNFEEYAGAYRPDKLGELPGLFEDMATVASFDELQLDSCGMGSEVARLEACLANGSVVGIVDGSEYHPELIGEVGGEKVKEDVEETEELWGNYVRPPARLVRAFARRLMNNQVSEELKDHSLVAVKKPGKAEKAMEALVKAFWGIDISTTPDLSQVNQLLSELSIHSRKTIIVLDAENVTDLQQYRRFLRTLEEFNLKVIVSNLPGPLPGLPNVLIEPFIDDEVAERLERDAPVICNHLELPNAISREVLQFTARQVGKLRQPSDDPLNLTLGVLHGAAQHCIMGGYDELEPHDVVEALPAIFHLPSREQIQSKIRVVDRFVDIAPLHVLGQSESIRQIGMLVKLHLEGLRNPTQPLTVLLPGPTGVGKTELVYKMALATNLPFFHIEGSQFTESHSLARLIGSPTGYVGPDEGILFKFLKDNVIGYVFIDEIEKMHPEVWQGLMNFCDKGMLTSGNAEVVKRPGFVIAAASNAGADKLHRRMTDRELMDTLSQGFRDPQGHPRPELIARFTLVPMLAIEDDEFRRVINLNLNQLGERFGFVSSNLKLVGVDQSACDVLLDGARSACEYEEQTHGFGFHGSQVVRPTEGIRIAEPTGADPSLYYNLRQIARTLDRRIGPSLQRIVEEQYATGRVANRSNARAVKIVGIPGEGRTPARLEVVDAD